MSAPAEDISLILLTGEGAGGKRAHEVTSDLEKVVGREHVTDEPIFAWQAVGKGQGAGQGGWAHLDMGSAVLSLTSRMASSATPFLRAFTIGAPKLVLGTKMPSWTEQWSHWQPAATAAFASSPRFRKSAFAMEGEITTGLVSGSAESMALIRVGLKALSSFDERRLTELVVV